MKISGFFRCWLAATLPAMALPMCGFASAPDDGSDALGQRVDRVEWQESSDAGVAAPAGGQWRALGPSGGDAADVNASPLQAGLLFAAIDLKSAKGCGLYRSTDDGAHWSAQPTFNGVAAFDIEFASSGRVYVGAADGLHWSDDGGAHWAAANLGIGINRVVLDVVVDPNDEQRIWLGIADGMGAQPVNLLLSQDAAVSWSNRTPPHAAAISGTAIAVAPGNSAAVVAAFGGAFGGGEVWTSSDGGSSWTNRSSGLPSNPVKAVYYDGARLLVAGGQRYGAQDFGLFRSSDFGAHWSAVHDASWPTRAITSIAVDPFDPNVMLLGTEGAGVQRSPDGGAHWQTPVDGTSGTDVRALRFRAHSSERLLLGASSFGVLESNDSGDSFQAATSGIFELPFYAIDADPRDPRRIALAFQGLNNGGVYSSNDGGQSWTAEPLPPTRYSALKFAPDGTLYAISSGPSSIAAEGLYRREPDGHWTALGPDQGPLYESDLRAIAFSPTQPALIVLGGRDYAAHRGTLWRSVDRGASWIKVYSSSENTFVNAIEMSTDGALLASYQHLSTPSAAGVLRSVDSGLNWTPARADLPANISIAQLCAAAGQARSFYLAASATTQTAALFKTEDAGEHWRATGWHGGAVAALACDPLRPETLYFAQAAAPVVSRSDDGGASVAAHADGLPASAEPTLLVATPLDDHRVQLLLSARPGAYAGLADDGLFVDAFE